MKKEEQDLFYGSVGRALTRAREQKKLSTSQLANQAEEQYNTVMAIEKGGRFSFHQVLWMKKILGVNLNILLNDAIAETGVGFETKEELNGDKKEESSGESLSDFI